MRIYFIILGLTYLILFSDCKRNPCSGLNEIYRYPTLPENHKMSGDEIINFYNLPLQNSICMSTDNLIESSLNYPYITLFFAGSTIQAGYDHVKNQFNGLNELEKRSDSGVCLLKRYESWDPIGFDENWSNLEIGKYMINGANIEIIQSQYVHLQSLNSSDFEQLFFKCLEMFDVKRTKFEYYGYLGLMFNTTTLARMMLLRNYSAFVQLYNLNPTVMSITDSYGPSEGSSILLIHEIAVGYSQTLKK